MDERYRCGRGKEKEVCGKWDVGVLEVYVCDGGKVVEGEEVRLVVVWVKMVDGKWICGYVGIVVWGGENMVEWYGVNGNGGVRKWEEIV